jgi:[FeFe] hydrogenase H-cluster maturation GTPase HydF
MAKGRENQPHIGIFGRRNKGKSSLINTIADQEVAIVSDTPGTTTDPVKKSIEITKIGAAVLIDTAGIDDVGELGTIRVEKTKNVYDIIDLAIIIISENDFDEIEEKLIDDLNNRDIPFFIIHNKSDIIKIDPELKKELQDRYRTDVVDHSVMKSDNSELISLIQKHLPESSYKSRSLLGDLIEYGDIVLLITPIDVEAPEGRLILPQVQAIRDILDNDAVAIVLKEREVDSFLKKTSIKPKLAITDSQIFLKADAMIPNDIPLTGFSVLLARYKGDFEAYLKGTPKISKLQNGDRILLLESCTHHVSCDDIGRVKIPRWISNFTGKELQFETVAGLNKLPRDIEEYSLIIQCGGCVLTRNQIIKRLKKANDADIPLTNYGMAIAYVQGIYNRAIEPFTKENNVDYL